MPKNVKTTLQYSLKTQIYKMITRFYHFPTKTKLKINGANYFKTKDLTRRKVE